MELLKVDKTPAEFKWKDVVFLYRNGVSAEDKFLVDTDGRHIKDNQIQYNAWDFCKKMIRIFVVGWRGVTEDGKEVPYSYDTFLTRLPADMQEDLVMILGYEIAVKNGFIEQEPKSEDVQKNV